MGEEIGKMYKENKSENQLNKVDLSDKAMENLRKNAESRQNESKFMKLQAGEKKNVLINGADGRHRFVQIVDLWKRRKD
jgi:hypothetical protein